MFLFILTQVYFQQSYHIDEGLTLLHIISKMISSNKTSHTYYRYIHHCYIMTILDLNVTDSIYFMFSDYIQKEDPYTVYKQERRLLDLIRDVKRYT